MSERALERPIPTLWNERRLTRGLFAIAIVLILVSALAQWALYNLPDFLGRDTLAELTSLGREANLPSAYSSLLLWLSSGLLWVSGRGHRAMGEAALARGFTVLSAVFAYLALDEAAQLHERSIVGVQRILQGFSDWLHYAWVLPYGVLTAVLVGFLWPWLRALPAATRRGLLLAGSLYVGGALGIEIFEGRLDAWGGAESGAMVVLVTVEESLEMLALVLLIRVLGNHLRRHLPGLRLDMGLRRSSGD